MPETSPCRDLETREALAGALAEAHREIRELFSSFDGDALFRRPGEEIWSPAENLVHLVRSVRAVASAMKRPKLALAVLFGLSFSGSRTYGQVVEAYNEKLRAGAKARGPYVPPRLTPEGGDTEAARQRVLSSWERTGSELLRVLDTWSERALDRYRLPHPLLGKMTVREILHFTHYHDLYHAESVRRRSRPSGG